ncbi:hypothetical protein BELL_1421g00020 [Botrytis elliptica]|uniref:Uncharacterized protein n=1 Tax=Botrytis elliptica TaxID=278938 RepID=A0A4Z1I934_9HELO|nr:hypothetical protein BELL_1421g00020 [Botrytis elliptica]
MKIQILFLPSAEILFKSREHRESIPVEKRVLTDRSSTRRVAHSYLQTSKVGKGYNDEVKFTVRSCRSQVTSLMHASGRKEMQMNLQRKSHAGILGKSGQGKLKAGEREEGRGKNGATVTVNRPHQITSDY